MYKKEMIAMLLTDGESKDLGVLTLGTAKSAVSFGGKYRIIDFALSNCVNSGIDTVGVLTQHRSQRLNTHIGIGIPWDLDRNAGGVILLPPYENNANVNYNDTAGGTEFACHTGTVNAVYQNIEYMESFEPDYVLILSADNVYKMDYGNMLAKHKESGAGISRAVIPAHYSDSDTDMGIYIFNWNVLMDFLKTYRDDIGADINSCIPGYAGENNVYVNIYEYNGYWKNLPDIGAYWEDCMELTSIVPEFNLYEDYWKIYTRSESQTPQYIAETAQTEQCIIGDDTDICGSVYNSVIGYGVTIAAGATVSNSIIMNNTYIGADSRIDMTVIGEDTKVGSNVRIGVNDAGTFDIQYKERAAERTWDNLSARITTIGEKSVIPDNVSIAAGAAVSGVTESTDYADSVLGSGMTLIKAGERS